MSKITEIQASNKALEFVADRVTSDAYRGNHLSQHNRYTFKEIDALLTLLDKHSPNQSLIAIRTEDLSSRPTNTVEERDYARFCDDFNQTIGRGTQDSIRKNLFVDMNRMGLLNRYGKRKQLNVPFAKSITAYVALSDEGYKLVRSSLIQKHFIFSKCLNDLLNSAIDFLLNIMRDADYNFNYITLTEYMLFISAVDYENKYSFSINTEQAKALIKSYRALAKVQQKQVEETLKEELNPKKFKGDKTDKRDYGNWRNEAQQTFDLLGQTVYFERDRTTSDERLIIKLGKDSVFEDVTRLNRSQAEIASYFKQHKIDKAAGFQLHHVVPLAWSSSKEHFKLLDVWKNMIYIDGFNHAKITVNKNRNVNMTIDDANDVLLADTTGNEVFLKYKEHVLYSTKLKDEMLSYNNMLVNEYK